MVEQNLPNKIWLENPTGKIPKGTVCDCCGRYNSRNSVGHALVIQKNKVLMVLRAHDPMSGFWGLPGGYIDWDETLEECALRELQEKTGYIGKNPVLFGIYSGSKRDQDGRQNVGIVYLVDQFSADTATTPEEILDVTWFDLDKLPEKIAFDHRQIIEDYKRKINKK